MFTKILMKIVTKKLSKSYTKNFMKLEVGTCLLFKFGFCEDFREYFCEDVKCIELSPWSGMFAAAMRMKAKASAGNRWTRSSRQTSPVFSESDTAPFHKERTSLNEGKAETSFAKR